MEVTDRTPLENIVIEYAVMQPDEKLVITTEDGTFIAGWRDNEQMMVDFRDLIQSTKDIQIFDVRRIFKDNSFAVIQNKIYLKSEINFMS